MATRPNAEDYLNIEIINDKELQKLFSELIPSVQNKIVLQGMRSAAKVILQQAKSYFKARQKNKSKTGYKEINRSFASEPMRSKFGLKVGVKHYKARWINWGTEDRYYKSSKKSYYRKSGSDTNIDKHFTGKIQPTNFFFDAVKLTRDRAQSNVSDAIIESLTKTVEKYNKT